MLTLLAGQPESLWDEALPVEVRELPADLAALDRLLGDPGLLAPIVAHWQREVRETRRAVLTEGRPTIAMETFVRLMVLKQRYRWGYRTLVAEVSDSIHLRRFCRIALSARVPDESTVQEADPADRRGDGGRADARIDRGSDAREAVPGAGGADRLDGDRGRREVPDRLGLAAQGVRALAREGRQARRARRRVEAAGAGSFAGAGTQAARVDAHDPAAQRRGEVRGAALDRRDGQAARAVDRGEQTAGSGGAQPGTRRGARAKLRAVAKLEQLADRCERVASQIKQRLAGEPISDRLVSLSDPGCEADPQGQARQADRVRLRDPARRVDREHPAWCARADPAAPEQAGQPGREHAAARYRRRVGAARALAEGGGSRRRLPHRPDDRGIQHSRARAAVHLRPPAAGLETHPAAAAALPDRLRGRISHLKRGYGLGRTRLKGDQGQQIWTGWSILAYNLDTLAIRTR